MRIYEVGGCVRDEIMGIASKDIDFSVVMDESDLQDHNGRRDPFRAMAETLTDMGFHIFVETPEHLTVRAQFPEGDGGFDVHRAGGVCKPGRKRLTADFVLARKEGTYSDGRRPDSVEVGTLHDDLARRDFTMNAIAKDSDGTLIDPFDGQRDIAMRIIRAVGDPKERLAEDALRAVRAMRFGVTKAFGIQRDLRDAMESDEVVDAVADNISDERIREELNKMLGYSTVVSLSYFQKFPALTSAIFSGSVSLEATMKQRKGGRQLPKTGKPTARPGYNGCTCYCHIKPGVMHMAACCRPSKED